MDYPDETEALRPVPMTQAVSGYVAAVWDAVAEKRTVRLRNGAIGYVPPWEAHIGQYVTIPLEDRLA